MFESLDFNTCMLLAAGGTLYFCSKPENERQEIVGNALWYITNKYYQMKIMFNDIFPNMNSCYEDKEEEENARDDDYDTTEIITYEKSEENGIYIAEIDEIKLNDLYYYKPKNKLTFIKYIENNKYYLKRLEYNSTDGYEADDDSVESECKEENEKMEEEVEQENKEDVEEEEVEEEEVEEEEVEEEEVEEEEDDKPNYAVNIHPVSKPFMQIDYEDNNSKIEIQGELEKFYVKDNKLFDKEFLAWYMDYYYQTKISNDYKIHILDENIKMFTLTNDQCVLITDDKDVNYKIIN